MSKTILTNVEGWTPLIDELVQKYGIITAAVFGRMWRYCQMEDGVCKASQEKIADELNVRRKTVNEHIKALIQGEYLKDLTPNLANKPHTYADTGKVKMKAGIFTVTESYSDGNAKLQPTVTESYSKKGLRNNLRNNNSGEPPAPKRERDTRLDNPAMIAYRKETQLYVPISWRDEVVRTVANCELWETVVHNWVGSGWNKSNLKGMLEIYRNGGASKNGNGRTYGKSPATPPSPDPSTYEQRRQARKEAAEREFQEAKK